MALCAITFNIQNASETAVEDVIIQANIVEPTEGDSSTTLFVPQRVETTTDANGDATLNLRQGLENVTIRILYPDGDSGTKDKTYVINVPVAATAEFNALIS